MRSLSTRAAGLLILILGLWGGLVPFIGPYFHFALGPNHSWTWTSGRFWLSVLPGAVAVLGGLMLLGAGPRPSGKLGAVLALAAGIWFAIGPEVSLLWNASGAQGVAHGSKGVRVLEMLTYHSLLGAVMAALAGYALPGLATRRTAVGGAEPAVAAAERGREREPMTAQRETEPVAAERETEPVAAEREPVPVAAEREPVPVAAERERVPAEPEHAPSEKPTRVAPAGEASAAPTAVMDRPTTTGSASASPATGSPATGSPATGSPTTVTARRRRGGLLSRLRS